MNARHNFEQNFAIIIGINSYKKQPLKLAVPDAELLSKILSDPERGDDEVYQTLLLTDEQATYSKLTTLLQNLEQHKINFNGKVVELKENHRLLFYFSGHGYASDRETERADENEQFLLCQDEEKLPMQELTERLGNLHCRHILLILDCCYSGAVRRALAQVPAYRTVTDDYEMSFRADYDRMVNRPTFTVITSAGYELALDSDHEHQENSYFAMALRKALECKADANDTGSQKADFNRDGIITAHELCTYLKNSPQVISRQSPQIYSLESSRERQGGQYLFLLPDFDPSHLTNLKERESPYKGLLSYEQQDAPIFFGRRRFIEDLFDRVYQKNQKLTVVIGVSGSGKSSLVKAGLLPRLQKTHPESWITGEFRPGSSPFVALLAAMKKCLGVEDNNNELENQVQAFHTALGEDARKRQHVALSEKAMLDSNEKEIDKIFKIFINASQAVDKKFLLFIDQFEELVTLCQTLERTLFLKLLKQMLDRSGTLQLVLTVRADFEVHFRGSSSSTDHVNSAIASDLSQYWNAENARLYVEEMTSHELRQVIERPAALLYVDFESDRLVSHLIDQVKGMPGALPLLSLTLDELYQKAKDTPDKKITQKHYEELGSVVKVVTDIANREYNALSAQKGEEQSVGQLRQNMMKLLMLRMTSLQGGQRAKRPVPLSELEYPQWRSRHKDATAQIKMVCEQLIRSRLITNQGQCIEPAHDALILHWDKMQEWIEQDKEEGNLVLRDRLIQDVQSWQEQKQQKQQVRFMPLLGWVGHGCGCIIEQQMRGNAALSQFRKHFIQWLNPLIWANRFKRSHLSHLTALKASNVPETSIMAASNHRNLGGYLWHNDPRLEQLRQLLYTKNSWLNSNETEFVRQSIIRKGFWSGVISMGVLLATGVIWGFGVKALYEEENAQIRNVESLRESAEANLKSGRQLEAAHDILEAHKTLSSIVPLFQEERVNLLGSSVQDTLFKLLYGTQERDRLQLDRGSLYEVVFNPNPQQDQLATVGQGDTVRLWNSQGDELAPLITGQEDVYSVSFRKDPKQPDQTLLVTGGIKGSIQFWDIQKDGSSIACKPANQVKVSSNPPCSVQVPSIAKDIIIDDVEFNANGKLLAIVEQNTNSEDNSQTSHVKLWKLVKQGQNASSYQFEDISSRISGTHKLGEEAVYWDVAFNPKKTNQLATVGENDIIRLWDTTSGNKLGEIHTRQGNVYSVTFDDDGTLLTGGSDGTIKTWKIEVQDKNTISIVPSDAEVIKIDQTKYIYSIAVKPDGSLATVGEDDVVQLRDSNGKPLKLIEPLEGSLSDSQTQGVVFSPDGRQLATLGSDTVIRLWDTSGKRLSRFPSDDDKTNNIAFNRDGKLLATVGLFDGKGSITLFDASSGDVIDYVSRPRNFSSIIFVPGTNPKEEQLAAIDENGGVVLLTVQQEQNEQNEQNDNNTPHFVRDAGGNPVIQSIGATESGLQPYGFGSDIQIKHLAFSMDGRYAAIAKSDGTVELKVAGSATFAPPDLKNVDRIAISPDNQRIVTTESDGLIKVWRIQDWLNSGAGTPIQPLEEFDTQQGQVSSLVFNPSNSNQLVTGGVDGTVRFWDLSANQPIPIPLLTERKPKTAATRENDNQLLIERELKIAATSANGNRLVTLSNQGTFNVWDLEGSVVKASSFSTQSLNGQTQFKSAKTLTLSSSGRYLAIIEGGNAWLWDIANDRQVGFIPAEQSQIQNIEFAPDENRLVVIRSNRVVSWILDETGQWQPSNPTQAIPNNGQTGDEPQSDADQDSLSNEQGIVSASFNPGRSEWTTLSGSRIDLATLSEDGTVKLWDAQGELIKLLFKTDQKAPHIIAFSPDGTRLATGAAEDAQTEGTVRIWTINGRRLQQFGAQRGDVQHIAFSQDGQNLAIVAGDKAEEQPANGTSDRKTNFMLFDVSDDVSDVSDDSREPINHNIQSGTVASAMFTPDDGLVTLSTTGRLSLWQMSDLQLQEGVCQLIWNSLDSETQKDLCAGVDAPLAQNFSTGEKLLINSNITVGKMEGIQAIASGDLPTAIRALQGSLDSKPNDPEARIYLNNAQTGNGASHTIAVAVPIGPNINAAQEILRGVAQAQQDINGNGGINGKLLRVMIANDNDDATFAQQIAQRLVDNPDIEGVVGHYASDTTKAANEIYEKGGLVSISPVSTAVNLFESGSPYAFRTVPNDQMAAQRLADYMVQQRKTTRAVVFYNSTSTYSKSISQEFIDAMQRQGGSAVERIDLSQADFDAAQIMQTIAAQRKQENTDIAIALFPNSGMLDKAIQIMKANTSNKFLMLGGDDVYSPTVLKDAGRAAVGIVVAVPWHINRKPNDPFVKTSRILWKADVNWRTVTAYDAVMALAKGLSYNPPTREGLAEILRVADFTADGATDSVKFQDGSGERNQQSDLVQVIRPPGGRSRSGTGFDFDAVPDESFSTR